MNILEVNLMLIIFFSLILLVFVNNKYSRILFIFFTTVNLIIFNGLRNVTVGTDTIRYERRFFNAQLPFDFTELSIVSDEVGYILLQRLFGLFSNNFNFLLFIIALIIFSLLGKFIYKYSKAYFISYVLFIGLGYYDFSFTGIRQTIAIIIILHTYKYILNRNFYRYLILLVFASSIHLSAIIFFPMYFLANISWKKHHIILVPAIYAVVYVFRLQIGKVVTLLYYDDSTVMLDRYISRGGIGELALFILMLIFIGIFVNSPFKYKDRENIVLTNIIVISFFIQSLSSFSYLFSRLNMYYLIFIILYIPNIVHNINNMPIKLNRRESKVISVVIKIILFIIILLYYINAIESNESNIFPYKFFWE